MNRISILLACLLFLICQSEVVFSQLSVQKESYYTLIDSNEKKKNPLNHKDTDPLRPVLMKDDSGRFYFQKADGEKLNLNVYEDAQDFEFAFAKIKNNGLWGFIDTNGVEVVSPKYDYVWSFSPEKVAIVQKKLKYGVVDSRGKELGEIKYDYLDFYQKGWAKFSVGNAVGYLDKDGVEYNEVAEINEGWFKVKKNGKWGLVNPYGVMAVAPIYDDVKSFRDGFASVNKGGKWVYVNNIGVEQPYDEIYFPFDTTTNTVKVRIHEAHYYLSKYGIEYDSVLAVSDNRSISYKNGLCGLLKKSGEPLLTPTYAYISNFYNGLAVVESKKQFGYIDVNGLEKIKPQFDSVYEFADNRLARVKKNRKYGFINDKGNVVIEIAYENAKDFSESLAQILYGGKWGYIDANNQLIVHPLYVETKPFFEGFALVKTKEGKNIYINKMGKEMTFDEIYPLKDSMAVVRKLNKFGYINMKGDIVIKGVYDEAQDFDHGLALVTLGNKRKLINKRGEELPYDNVYPFRDGLARVEKGGKVGFVNKNGVEAIPAIYNTATDFDNGVSVANGDGKDIYVFKSGVTYDWIGGYVNKMAIVKKNMKYGIVNKDGFQLLPPNYDGISFTSNGEYAFAQTGGNYVLVDQFGIVKNYDYAMPFSEGLAVVIKANKFGFINIAGKEVIGFEFEWADSFREGKALVRKDGKYFYINMQGQIIK